MIGIAIMKFWDFYPDGEVEITPAEWALDMPVRELFKDGGLKVMVYASGIQFAIVGIETPPALTITPNQRVKPRKPKRDSAGS